MLLAYFQYIQAYNRADVNDIAILTLREEAEESISKFCFQQGYNFVHHEEFEFLVDKHVWDNFCK
jgi:hypothetical protein